MIAIMIQRDRLKPVGLHHMMRKELREHEADVWSKLFDGMIAQYWVLFAIKAVAIVGGGIIAAIGGGMEGPLRDSAGFTTKGFTILGGAGAAMLAGLVLLLADRERPNLINDVRAHLSKLREYVDRYDDMIARESWRIDCDSASRVMLETVENVLLQPSGSVSDDVQTLLDFATPHLLDALSIGYAEDYTFSIFQRSDALGCMVRIADKWFHEDDAEHDQRPWAKGQGFTGQAWLAKKSIGVADANAAGVREAYAQKPEDYPQELRDYKVRPDEERYRSFLCVPIMVGAEPEPWGILTVTSDAMGRFDHIEGDTPGSDNVQIMRLTAALIALLVASATKT